MKVQINVCSAVYVYMYIHACVHVSGEQFS